MPKKFAGENSKATAARARKFAIKAEKKAEEMSAKEDAYWADNDRHVQRKLQRKQEEEQKRQQQLERKQQNKQQYEEELKSLGTSTISKMTASNPITKVTLAQIEQRHRAEQLRHEEEEERRLQEKNKLVIVDQEITENLNHLVVDGEVASTVDEAIHVLNNSKNSPAVDRAQSVKAAFTAFEEHRLPELKKMHPTLRLSQLKQLLRKEWLKSPENPLNQKILNILR